MWSTFGWCGFLRRQEKPTLINPSQIHTTAPMKIGTVTGNIKSGTVSWLNRARAVKTVVGVRGPSPIQLYTARVITATRTDAMCVRRARNNKIIIIMKNGDKVS